MKVTKVFNFCYGHRLSGYTGKCFNLHGHNGLLEVTLEGKLKQNGMVLDFGIIKQSVNKVLDEEFDHKTILKSDDPINTKLIRACSDIIDSFRLVNYNPTAENMAIDIWNQVASKIASDIKVTKIKLYETPTSFVEYEGEV